MRRALAVQIVAEGLRPGAGGPGARERRRAVEDWSLPIALANEHLVGPAFFAALRAAGAEGDLPDDARGYLELLHRSNAERNAALRRQLTELLYKLERAGIEAMLLKGARSFAVGLYADPGSRMFRDLDVVVRPERVERALEVLAAMGYGVANTYLPEQNAVAELTRRGDPGAVDLHVEIVDVRHLLGAAEMWNRAVPVTVGGIPCMVPSATDAVLHHLIHAQIHFRGAYYFGAVELRQLYEFAALARHGGAELDWGSVADRLAQHGLRTMLESYALMARRLFGMPWPLTSLPSAAARLHERRCALNLALPRVEAWAAPWANLRAAFAGHRMRARYPKLRTATQRRLLHLAQFLRKTTAGGLAHRLLRDRY